MKVAIVADFHGDLPDIKQMPKADVLVIAGDVCPLRNYSQEFQRWWLTNVFEPWLRHLYMYTRVIGIAGNHDFIAQAPGGYELMSNLAWTYLEDESTKFYDVTFYGSPYSNRFHQWAFMESDEELAQRWAMIPRHTDVLIVHGPAYRLLDRVNNEWGDAKRDRNVGSKSLRDTLTIVKPKLFICGHIHEGYGRATLDDTLVVNGSYNDENYNSIKNPIQVVEL